MIVPGREEGRNSAGAVESLVVQPYLGALSSEVLGRKLVEEPGD